MDGRMGRPREEWKYGQRDARTQKEIGMGGKDPPAPLPHLHITIEFPEPLVSQDLGYGCPGHPLQPCNTITGLEFLP